MFGALVRVTAVLVAASLISLTLGMVGGQLLDTQADVAGQETANHQWMDVVVTWFPAIGIATICVILIGGAIARRQRVV